ncbi:MAG: chromosome segregation protein SMC [Acidiferrobacteraceae bacterium]|nr:chromosome segregation protein SMC [Acidiferrobacteraceae bacterium]
MRLKKIHVSGFKSFVDPTAITIPADVTGIIGPNGCGKSNVIDAVRWVMGESSARKLRGDSMADVIFNGSEARKPVGKAAVELIFDNTDGKSAQTYARFSEISVKRTLSRDGTSEYLLNKARCRRRDITDLFRGTGLGHRSYSIIEQGMVSRIVEARPEELRVFVEEAAGISHYKDRRRETETRMRHTRENLSRVEDIRKELDTQLRRLQRQSQAARRYQKLKEEEQEVNGQLLGLRYLAQKGAAEEQAALTTRAQTEVESHRVRQRGLESQIETLRADEMASQQEVSDRQAAFYAAGAEVASLEQAIEHAKETGEQQRAEFERLQITLGELATEYQHDEERIESLTADVGDLTGQRDQAVIACEQAASRQQEGERDFEDWQHRWNEFTQLATTPIKDQEVQRSRIEQLESVDAKAQERLARLDEEIGTLLNEEERLEVDTARSSVAQKEADLAEAEGRVNKVMTLITNTREEMDSRTGVLDGQRQHMHATRSRLQSLQELQETSLDRDEAYSEWLDQRGLSHAPRLAGEIRVTSGWERAADAVLGARLSGLGIADLPKALAGDEELPRQELFFMESGKFSLTTGDNTLLSYVSCERYNLESLLAGVYVAEDLNEALARRDQLGASESIVTKSGIVVGPNWAHAPRGQGAAQGLLEREEEVSRLQDEVPVLESQVAEHEHELERLRARLEDLESQQQAARDSAGQMLEALNAARQTFADRQARFDQIEVRRQQLADESEEIVAELTRTGSDLDEARRHFAIAEDETGALERQRKDLLEEKEVMTRALSAARLQVQSMQDRRHETELALQHSQASLDSHRSSLARLQVQSHRMRGRYQQLKGQISSGEDPGMALGERLQILLAQRAEAEGALAEGRDRHASIEQQIRQVHGSLSECEQEVASAREVLESKRLKDQELSVRLQTLQEQIVEDKYVLDELIESLPEDAEEGGWIERSERLAQKITNIGPVNLIAIEEYEEQAERKEYLDSQHADLVEALDTLAGVIRKIDRETRERFRSTFDSLNQGFADFFPQLFGGGSAVLELTEDDLLAAGVTVMARPPGKRNSTIHLLSGGEKALAAVALLFALFKLNPAPFCILDEVDAPLDDRNVERYCKTLRTLSEVSQLVVITHNKITMESTDVLLGVTMGEPGVSSIVSVDVDEAVRLAAQ